MKIYIIKKREVINYDAMSILVGAALTKERAIAIIKEEKLKDFINNDFDDEFIIPYDYIIIEVDADKSLEHHTPEELLEKEINSRKEDFKNCTDAEAEEMMKDPFYDETLIRQKFNDYKNVLKEKYDSI